MRDSIKDTASKTKISQLSELCRLDKIEALLMAKNALDNGDSKFMDLIKSHAAVFVEIVIQISGQSLRG